MKSDDTRIAEAVGEILKIAAKTGDESVTPLPTMLTVLNAAYAVAVTNLVRAGQPLDRVVASMRRDCENNITAMQQRLGRTIIIPKGIDQ